MSGFGWGLDEATEEYLRGGARLDAEDAFGQGVFWSWALAESPGSAAVLELRVACGQWRGSPSDAGLADLVARADAAGIQHGPDGESLERAVEELFWRDWATFEHRLEQCRQGAGDSGGVVAEQAYHWVVEQLTAENPDFPALLAGEPELASALYAEAVRRFGHAG